VDTSNQAQTEIIAEKPVNPVAPRQRRSVEEKRKIVEKTLIPGASVARIARAQGVNANQVFSWRRLYRKGQLGDRATKLLPDATEDQRLLRRWTPDEKQKMVEATLAGNASIRQIAEAHGIRPGLLYDWRKKYHRKRGAAKSRLRACCPWH